jgi:hypothetical protein
MTLIRVHPGFPFFVRPRADLPISGRRSYSRVMSSGDFTTILRLSSLSALALGLLLRPAR